MMEYKLVLDEPTSFLNARKNPVKGRLLTFELADGTMIELNVSLADYLNRDRVLEKLQAEIAAHEGIKSL